MTSALYRRLLAVFLADAILGMGVFCLFLPVWAVTLVIALVLLRDLSAGGVFFSGFLLGGVSLHVRFTVGLLRSAWRLPRELWSGP